MRNLTLEEKIVIFKTSVISKIVFQSLIKTIPNHIVKEHEKNTGLLWKHSTPKIKHEMLCNDYKGECLKNINI